MRSRELPSTTFEGPYVLVNELANDNRRITFGTHPEFWLKIGLVLDLHRAISGEKGAEKWGR